MNHFFIPCVNNSIRCSGGNNDMNAEIITTYTFCRNSDKKRYNCTSKISILFLKIPPGKIERVAHVEWTMCVIMNRMLKMVIKYCIVVLSLRFSHL